MTVDHIGAFLHPDWVWLRAIGRVTVPVWFFLIGHALHYRSSRDLVLWAVMLAVLNAWLGRPCFPLNTLITILMCQAVLRGVEKYQLLARELPMVLLSCLLFLFPTSLLMEYGTTGVLYALMGYAVRSGQMTWRTGKLVTLLALGIYLATQLDGFEFSVLQSLFIVAVTTGVTLYLAQFTHRPVTFWPMPVWTARVTLWLSRHSMQYYVIHRVVLQSIGVVTGVLNPALRWL